MRLRGRRRAAFGVAAAGLLTAAAQDAPRSILPPGMGGEQVQPQQQAPRAPAQPQQQRPAQPALAPGQGEPDQPASILPPTLGGGPGPADTVAPVAPVFPPEQQPRQGGLVQNPPPDPLVAAAPSNVDLSHHGLLGVERGGLGDAVWAGTDGQFVAGLLRRLDGPGASRFGNQLLARARARRAAAPAGARPADWVAVRAAALTKAGFADMAHAMVAPVPVDAYTPPLYAAALMANLGVGDLAAICPLAPTGAQLSRAPVWRLSQGFCSAFENDDIGSARAFDALRDEKGVSAFDISLAEFVASQLGGGRAANLAWEEADGLDLYRIGVVNAAGAAVPDELRQRLPAAAAGWTVRSPSAPDSARLAAAPRAAELGVIGATELASLYSAFDARGDAGGAGGDVPGQLRVAFAGAAPDRVGAMRRLWENEGLGRYAALILTAEPALRLAPDRRFGSDAADLMEAAAAGGRLDRALAWGAIAKAEGSATEQRGWPIMAIADPRAEVTPSRFGDWLDRERSRVGRERADLRARLLLAALIGSGRAGGQGWDGHVRELRLEDRPSAWSGRIQQAAVAGRRGEVVILAATGLAAPGWLSVPPQHLRHIVATLGRVGLSRDAQLIATEALSRT